MQERLQKVLASAGIGSRRECENIILEGRVTVDGERVTALGATVDAGKSVIYCDGMPIRPESKIYYLLNKPKDCLCTNYDELNRLRAIDIIKNVKQRLYTIGRLDKQSEGLIIITNDGELSNKLSHPKYDVNKTYFIEIDGYLSNETITALQSGVWLSFGKTQPVRIKKMHRSFKKSRFEMILCEGKNREIRRMLADHGHKVRTLRRIKIGSLCDPDLKVGKYRKLTDQEIKNLYSMTEKNLIEKKSGKQRYDTVTASKKK